MKILVFLAAILTMVTAPVFADEKADESATIMDEARIRDQNNEIGTGPLVKAVFTGYAKPASAGAKLVKTNKVKSITTPANNKKSERPSKPAESSDN